MSFGNKPALVILTSEPGLSRGVRSVTSLEWNWEEMLILYNTFKGESRYPSEILYQWLIRQGLED